MLACVTIRKAPHFDGRYVRFTLKANEGQDIAAIIFLRATLLVIVHGAANLLPT